jgi:hypothetical protein
MKNEVSRKLGVVFLVVAKRGHVWLARILGCVCEVEEQIGTYVEA